MADSCGQQPAGCTFPVPAHMQAPAAPQVEEVREALLESDATLAHLAAHLKHKGVRLLLVVCRAMVPVLPA